jgi:hypothetical protein
MRLPIDHLSNRVPRRLPIGAKYVVEGFGGGEGNLRVIARYVLLPDGCRINVPADRSRPTLARALPLRWSPNAKRSETKRRPPNRSEKFAARRGTR